MGHSLGRREVSRRGGNGRRIYKPRMSGFTLVEIMVVVVIIAIVTAAVTLSVGLTGEDREVEKEGERALALMTYAREQAELETREYGLFVEQDGYQFLKFEPRMGTWRSIEEDDTLRARKLPSGVRIQLLVEGRPIVLRPPPDKDDEEEAKNWQPHVMIFSNGDLTPFELTLLREGDETRSTIRSNDEGTIEAVAPEGTRG